MTGSQFLVSMIGAVGSCFGLLLFLYNVVSAALFLREATEGSSSTMARLSWLLGITAVFLWWMPCVGAAIAIAAIATSRIERGRIFRDEAALAGVTPIRMGNVNGTLVLVLQLLVLVGMVAVAVSGFTG